MLSKVFIRLHFSNLSNDVSSSTLSRDMTFSSHSNTLSRMYGNDDGGDIPYIGPDTRYRDILIFDCRLRQLPGHELRASMIFEAIIEVLRTRVLSLRGV